MDGKYYVGLDIGSDSVGWATTDENFNLLKLRGKTAWGVRLFDEAKSAKERRTFRTQKRRLRRRKYRIYLLNEFVFKDEINKIDQSFFLRMSESNYVVDDKSGKEEHRYPLFLSKKVEQEFYKKYPTIYHLRKAQLNNDPEAFKDLRYVYLTIHHIIKKRGNFLQEGTIDFKRIDKDLVFQLNDSFRNIENAEDVCDIFTYTILEKIVEILLCDETKNAKKKLIKELLNNDVINDDAIKNYIEMFITIIVGGTYDLNKLSEEKNDDLKKLTFDSNYDDNYSMFEAALGDNILIVDLAKTIFDFASIKKILGDDIYLSDAMVKVYEKHRDELKTLKRLLNSVDEANNDKNRTIYKSVFQIIKQDIPSDDDGDGKEEKTISNYAWFIAKPSKNSNADFNKYIRATLQKISDENIKNSADFKTIEKLVANNELLRRISDVKDSKFPHQLHEKELELIIDNASQYYPFLKDKKDKILSIFKFRINYYEGPLDDRSSYSNVCRLSNDKIYPWNKDHIIDSDRTKQNFIRKLTNYCTYLVGEHVLPQDSIIFTDFVNLNRLNTMIINGSQISQDIKLDLFDNLINKRAKVTLKQIEKYLKKYEVYKQDGVNISGINSEDTFGNPARSILGSVFDLNDSEIIKKLDEDVISILAIYGSDGKKDAIDYIWKHNKQFSEEQIKAIKKLNCKKWGTLSMRLLTGIRCVDSMGVVSNSIIELLHDTTKNFQQILNDSEYNFLNLIRKENKNAQGNLTNKQRIEEIIENAPPMMRRPTIQAYRIVKEIQKVAKSSPDKICIEVTRTNKDKNKGKMSNSRRKELENFLAPIQKDAKDLFSKDAKELLGELNNVTDDLKLKGRHLYLYFKQLGYDLYTGKKIDINDVLNSNKYDTDHIIPQSKIKDDSLDNLVLVNKHDNQVLKGDRYPLPETIQNNEEVQKLWKYLKIKNQISDKKYNNLIRKTPLSDDELNEFVHRQINVVNHANKVLKDILEIAFPKADIIFSKAENATYLRKYLDIIKLRELNDAHHAVDAYLNVVAGTILESHFNARSKMPLEKQKYTYNPERALEYHIEKADIAKKIQKICDGQDMLFTQREQYPDDAFYGQTVLPKKDFPNELVPLHTSGVLSDVTKYGGYNNLARSYFMVGINRKKEKVLIDVPILYTKLYKDKEQLKEKTLEYFGERIELIPNVIINPKTIVSIDDVCYLITPSNRKQISLTLFDQLFLNKELVGKIKVIIKKQTDKDNFIATKLCDEDIKKRSEENLNIYKTLLECAASRKYASYNLFKNYRTNIDSLLESFGKMSINEQEIQIIKLLKLFNRSSGLAHFLLSKNKVFENNTAIIKTSITGLFEKKIKL